MKEYRFSAWKTKNKNYRSGSGRVLEEIRFRDLNIDSGLRVEEGMVVSHEEKAAEKDAKYYPTQQLGGYHYISLIDKNKDRLWIQGYMRHNSNYAVFSSDEEGATKVEQNFAKESIAFEKFEKLLKNRGVKINGDSLGENNIIINDLKCFNVGKDFLDCEIKTAHITNGLGTLEIRNPMHHLTPFSGHLNIVPSKAKKLYDRQGIQIFSDNQERTISFNRSWNHIRLRGVRIE